MKRTHKMLTVMGLVLPALYFGPTNEAAAFCIHNWTDTVIAVEQVHGGTHIPFKKFYEYINIGEKKCCNWKTHDCNTQGDRHAEVKFDVWFDVPSATNYSRADGSGKAFICKNYTIKANGKIVVHGTGSLMPPPLRDDNYTCKKE